MGLIGGVYYIHTLMPFNTSLTSLILESLCDICLNCNFLLHEARQELRGTINIMTANPAKMDGPMVR